MKTIKELGFDNLYMEYKVLTKVDAATADEEFGKLFNELIIKCANELYAGNTDDIVLHKALYNNLVADKRTRFGDVDKYFNGYLPERALKLQLVKLVNELLPREKRIVTKSKAEVATGKANKPAWQYTEDDVLALVDVDTVDKFINSIGSAKVKSREAAVKHFGLTDTDEAADRFDAIRALARVHKENLTKPQLSEALLAKLNSGKHATLSAAEVEALRKLLG